MADVIEIKAAARTRTGKGAARAVRRDGKVPAVVYGNAEEAERIAVDFNELKKLVQRGRFLSTVFDLSLDGKTQRVLPREVQRDPVMDYPIHVDFQRIAADGRVRVGVAVKFIHEVLSPGLKRGGVLNIVRHEIECWCPADKIPPFVEVDLTGLEIGRSVHISAVKLPEGVQPTITNRDFTVATIAGAAAMKPEVVEGAEAVAVEGAEGEAVEGATPAEGEAKEAAGKEAAGKGGDKAAAKGGDKAAAKDEKKK